MCICEEQLDMASCLSLRLTCTTFYQLYTRHDAEETWKGPAYNAITSAARHGYVHFTLWLMDEFRFNSMAVPLQSAAKGLSLFLSGLTFQVVKRAFSRTLRTVFHS